MDELHLYADWGSTGESSRSTDDTLTDKVDPTTRFRRVEDMMRMFSSPSAGSRRFTSVIVDNREQNLLSYGTYAVENNEQPKRTSTRMANFVNAMRIIYGGHESLSPSSFIHWRRKLMNWIKLSTLKKRAARGSQFIYTIDPRASKQENRFQIQKIRERLWNELKTHEFCLNNFIEQEKMCKQLEAVKKKQMRKEVKDLAKREYFRVHNLINQGLLTPEEVACLREQYSMEPPKFIPGQMRGKPAENGTPYVYIPAIETKTPIYHNMSYLEQIMKARLKQLNKETPEVKKTLYHMAQGRSSFTSDALHQLLEEVFGPPSIRPSTTTLSGISRSSQTSQGSEIKSTIWPEAYSLESSVSKVDKKERNPVTKRKIPLGQTTSNLAQWNDEVYENESIRYLYAQAELLFPNLRYRSQGHS
ncbi:hypothetical protein D915_003899 [Fasciola hepatica]|uniref:Uncharacterized protein n=1 Tax=Fasciola hepatica TaxID=6192 RepID=A0A4E0RV81_FASHE|nr:hypothetical protein D915_003899 [Fasciola hepatica]